jgi:hypothetical protein
MESLGQRTLSSLTKLSGLNFCKDLVYEFAGSGHGFVLWTLIV